MDILIILFIVLMIVTVVGHLNWVAIRWIVRWFSADEVVTDEEPRKPSDPRHQRMKDLAITEHQITRFYTDGKLSDEVFQHLMKLIQADRGTLRLRNRLSPPSQSRSFHRITGLNRIYMIILIIM